MRNLAWKWGGGTAAIMRIILLVPAPPSGFS